MLFYNKEIFERCFCYRAKYWYKNIASIPLYFKLMRHLVKYGYDEYATWETASWFIRTLKPILQEYRSNHHGYPVISYDDKELQAQSEQEYDADLDRMIELLDLMDENNPKYDAKDLLKAYQERDVAKDEFFELLAKHFYSLWD